MDPSTKEISFDANDPEMTSFITNYTDRGTIIYWLEGTESADWFPNWTYESWQANCLTSPSSVHYGANIIDATLSAFLIAGTVSDTVESVSLDLLYGQKEDSLLIDATANALDLGEWFYIVKMILPPWIHLPPR